MSGEPLVLVHGFMGGSEQWHLQAQELGREHELIAIDLPGFGENRELMPRDTIFGLSQFVLDCLSDSKVKEFKLLGHSMGGMIVQEMVATAPHLVKQLVLYGTSATGNLPDRFESFQTSRKRVVEDGLVASARRISATWFRDHGKASEFEKCASIAEKSSLQAIFMALDAMEAWSGLENLREINCPTLIVWGENDRTYRWPQIEELWTKIPTASLAVLPGCAHAAHIEKPEIFNWIIQDFLTQGNSLSS